MDEPKGLAVELAIELAKDPNKTWSQAANEMRLYDIQTWEIKMSRLKRKASATLGS